MTNQPTRTFSFEELGLKKELLEAIQKNGIETASDVQQKSIPYILERRDVRVQAKSGLGKTLCFVLSILQMIEPEDKTDKIQPQVLVIANTKELSVQISEEFKRFAVNIPKIRIASISGGIAVEQQIKMLKEVNPNIIVATTGRLADLMRRNEIDLSKVEYFVIDEADTILCPQKSEKQSKKPEDKSLEEILAALPQKTVQTMLFSATFSEESKEKAEKILNKAYKSIELDDKQLVLHGLKQSFIKLTEPEKLKQIINVLDQTPFTQCIIFVKSQDRAKALQQYLENNKIACKNFYGKMSADARQELFREFKQKQVRIIIATDIFQRGVDFESLDLVIHFDMPINSDAYLHRSGRAGRFETKGTVISFVTEAENSILEEIQNRFAVKIEEQTK